MRIALVLNSFLMVSVIERAMEGLVTNVVNCFVVWNRVVKKHAFSLYTTLYSAVRMAKRH